MPHASVIPRPRLLCRDSSGKCAPCLRAIVTRGLGEQSMKGSAMEKFDKLEGNLM